MRIGIVTTWTERGGTYVSRQLIQALRGRHEVCIYARGTAYKTSLGDNEPEIYWGRIPAIPQTNTAIDLKDFEAWTERKALDIVLFNEQAWWMPAALCFEKGILTGTYVDYYTKETTALFDGYDFLICNTKRHLSVFNKHPQAYFIPWGTDTKLFKPAPSPEENRPLTFFHSCGKSPFRKGTDLLLEAFSRLSSDAKLVIHAQKDILKEIPGSAEVLNKLLALGKVEIIERTVPAPGLYHLGDVYVYPSRLDGIGLTIAESLSCGLPVITPDNAPMNEFIKGRNGTLVPVASYSRRKDGYYWDMCQVDIDALTAAMEYYCKLSAEELRELKAEARRSAELSFNWEINSKPLAGMIANTKAADRQLKLEIASRIRKMEKSRGGRPLRFYYAMPWLYSFLLRPARILKRKYKRTS